MWHKLVKLIWDNRWTVRGTSLVTFGLGGALYIAVLHIPVDWTAVILLGMFSVVCFITAVPSFFGFEDRVVQASICELKRGDLVKYEGQYALVEHVHPQPESDLTVRIDLFVRTGRRPYFIKVTEVKRMFRSGSREPINFAETMCELAR